MQQIDYAVLICTVDLCTILYDSKSDKDLIEETFRFIKAKELLQVNKEHISRVVKKSASANLYRAYKDSPEKIVNIHILIGLLRGLWLNNILASNYSNITLLDVQKKIVQKYEEEKILNGELTSKDFHLFQKVDARFQDEETLFKTGKTLSKILDVFPLAYATLKDIFTKMELDYLFEIYNEKTGTEKFGTKKVTKPIVDDSSSSKELKNADMVLNKELEEEIKHIKEKSFKKETSLHDIIGILERTKHDLELRIIHAKKDAIREILTALTDYGWGAPLCELYLVSKDKNTPDKIRGIIDNLFLAFGEQNIKLVRKKLIGETIILNEENQRNFDPYRNEKVFLSDEVMVYYPGFRYDKEIMVRPTVRKKQPIKEDL